MIIKTKAVTVVKCFYGNTYVPRRRSNFLPLRLPHSSQSPQFLEKAWKCHLLLTCCVVTPTCKNFWPHIMKPLVVLVKLCQVLSSKDHGRPPCWHTTSGYSCRYPAVSVKIYLQIFTHTVFCPGALGGIPSLNTLFKGKFSSPHKSCKFICDMYLVYVRRLQCIWTGYLLKIDHGKFLCVN